MIKLCLVSYFYMNFTYFYDHLSCECSIKATTIFFSAEVLLVVHTFNNLK